VKKIYLLILIFLKDRFNLSHEQEDHFETIKSIEKAIDFRGINVWTLIFAIFIASVGLNVNSTAVIIGAMLISPLMGPIMGLGLSVGIYDFALLKRSLKNFTIAVVISILTSAIYFTLSPLEEAQSELLARTTPSIYDVLIALFGGLAGIVAGASKEKGNTIPGVAIATALMPPLCTAGYGIATGNLWFFLGAFYLFFINTVMISLSAFLIVRFLKFPLKSTSGDIYSKRIKKYILIIVTITVLPSIYLGYQIIQQSIFKSNATIFLIQEMSFNETPIINKNFIHSYTDSNAIEVVLAGKPIEEEKYTELKSKLQKYSLYKTKLILKQGSENIAQVDMGQLKSGIIEEIYKKNEVALQDKEMKIKVLENEIISLRGKQIPIKNISKEINALNSDIKIFSAYRTASFNITTNKMDSILIVYMQTKNKIERKDVTMLENWLKKRLEYENIKMIVE